jgi:farnesyl diphosphate synthase
MTGETLADALKRVAGEVEQALDVLLPVPEGAEARLFEAMRYSALGGGKRLRGFLVMAGGGAVLGRSRLRGAGGGVGGDAARLFADP